MGWASGFQAGTSMAKNWMDVYEKSKQERLMAEARQRADLGDYQRYSQADAANLQEYANATNEQGQPLYRLSVDPGSTQYRVQQIMYPDIPQQSPSLDFVVPDRAPAGLAPQPTSSSDAQSYGVPMDVMPEERVLVPGTGAAPIYAEFGQGGAPVRPDLGYAMTPRGGGLEAPAPQGQPPFDVPEANYSPTLDVERLQDSRAYQGLTREYGPETTLAPSRTVYMGREYEPGTLTDSEKRSRLQEAYADVYEKMGKPAEAMQLRAAAMGLRKGTLELQDLEATAEKKKSLRDIQSSMSSWFKQRVGDRQPTADDYEAFDTKVISDLMAGGHVDEANAAFDRRNRVVMERIKMEEAARGQAINEAVFALSSGDLKPTVELYNRFVHDGAKVTNVVRNDKDGSVTVKRQAADGTDLPDYKFGSLDELTASLRSLTDSGAFAAYTQNTFMNNIRTKTLAVEERKAAADERRAGAYERRANAAENRAEREAVVYLTDGKQVYEYRRSSLPYDKSGRLQLPDGMSIYKGQGQVSQGNLTKEQETALRAIEGSEAFKSAYDTVNDPNTPAAEKRAAAARIEQMLKQRGLPPDLYKFEQYEHQPMP